MVRQGYFGFLALRMITVMALLVCPASQAAAACNMAAGAAGYAPLALLLVPPLCAFARSKDSIRK